MIILAENKEYGATIFIWDEGDDNPVFKIVVGDYQYSHSVRGIEDPEKYDWYCNVMGSHFTELHKRSLKQGRKEVQDLFNKAMSL